MNEQIVIKPEYPRPQLVRGSYINLNGSWEFEIDNSLSEKEKGIFKKEIELLETIALEDIKTYNDVVQIKQKGASAEIQTKTKNITFNFSGLIEARKFVGKAIDASTGTTLAKRSSNKVKSALDLTDDTLGLDTRGTIKSVLEQGIKGTLINGIKKKK